MKKGTLLIFLFSSLTLFSCKGNNIDLPKSPFEDTYERIGMNSEYETDGIALSTDEYQKLKECVNNETINYKSSNYIRQQETRDLKYAYFGRESSVISQCSMLSQTENFNRYKNNVTINEAISNSQSQTGGGIIKNNSSLIDYTFDNGFKSKLANTYSHRIKNIYNDQSEIVTEDKDKIPYDDGAINLIFSLSPSTSIKNEFAIGKIRGVDFNFKLLGDNNNAVYGKVKNTDKYLIKEGYSLFAPYTTTIGRTYKAVDNFFYEGLLEKVDESFRFTNFRFYHEVLILSESYDGEGVPVLFLEKPVLIEYSEIKYSIFYNELTSYSDSIPDVTK